MYDEIIFWGFIVCCASAIIFCFALLDYVIRSTWMFLSGSRSKKHIKNSIESNDVILEDPKKLDLPSHLNKSVHGNLTTEEFTPLDLLNDSAVNKILKDTHELDREQITFESAYESLKTLPEHLRESYLKHYALHPHLVKALLKALEK